MPWCPKCTYEYQNGFTKCSDCGSELVDEDPVSRIGVRRDWLTLLELTLIFAFSFPMWFLLALVSTNAEIPMPLLPPTAIVWGGGFMYGLIRRFEIAFGTWLTALAIGTMVQAGAEIMMIAVFDGEAWKLMFTMPFGILFSSVCMVLTWVGSGLYHHRNGGL